MIIRVWGSGNFRGLGYNEAMKLYICWSTNGGDHHDCAKADKALRAAGYEFETIRARGQEKLPKFLQFKTRREVFALTGRYYVPAVVFDDGTAVSGADEIVAWAKSHPAKQ